MIGNIIKSIANIALDVAAVKTIQLNSQEPRTRDERARVQQQRRQISNVRNAAWLAKRLLG